MEDKVKQILDIIIENNLIINPIKVFNTFKEAREFLMGFKFNAHPFGSDIRILESNKGYIIAVKDMKTIAPGPYDPIRWLTLGQPLFVRLNGVLN